MDEQCFYCNQAIEEKYHHGVFVMQNEHVEKPLCQDCYKEWLEGMKEQSIYFYFKAKTTTDFTLLHQFYDKEPACTNYQYLFEMFISTNHGKFEHFS